jgi:hypothetical protein
MRNSEHGIQKVSAAQRHENYVLLCGRALIDSLSFKARVVKDWKFTYFSCLYVDNRLDSFYNPTMREIKRLAKFTATRHRYIQTESWEAAETLHVAVSIEHSVALHSQGEDLVIFTSNFASDDEYHL